MDWNTINLSKLPSPCYIIDCDILKKNLYTLKQNCDILGIKPLISLKGFPLASVFSDMKPYIQGLSASSLFEAQLAKHLGKEIHIHSPAYKPDEIRTIMELCDHVVFNSFSQWKRYKNFISESFKHPCCGLRINPEHSIVEIDKYNACSKYSRFGVKKEQLLEQDITGINGFHLHIMYDQDTQVFANVADIIINKFGSFLPQLSWINFGGGQRLADNNCQIALLQKSMSKLTNQFGLTVYVEPCEAIITECGYLFSTVLDIVNNNKKTIALLDTSAVCHMPDVLEMPYHPALELPVEKREGKYKYVLAGITCLAGDIMGEYEFNTPLKVGDNVVFSEMGAYTFAKENYFNGINYPAIVLYDKTQGLRILKQYNYQNYESQYL